MSERLRRFLIALASDEDRTERFVKEALADSDLTAEEKAVVLSRDPVRLRRALGDTKARPTQILKWFKKRAKKKRTSRRKTKAPRYSASKRSRGISKKRSRRATKSRRRG